MDVGANIGWFTFAVASTGTHVIAFEPFSNNIKAIKSSMCSNLEIAPLIHLQETGLGDKNSSCKLLSESYNLLNGMVNCEPSQTAPTAQFREEIHTITLDSYIGTIPDNWMPGVMKIDSEGYDYYILKGGKNFLQTYKIPFIIVEFEPIFMSRLGYTP